MAGPGAIWRKALYLGDMARMQHRSVVNLLLLAEREPVDAFEELT
jgi:hypothetical protein